MRWVMVALGVLMTVVGGLWAFESFGWIGGSAKEGEQFWATTGAVIAGLGVALVWVASRPRSR